MGKLQSDGFGVYGIETGRQLKLAMQELWLEGTVLPVGARLVVRHVFKSAESRPLEVVYAFGLPMDAALRSFRVSGEGFEMESALKPVDEARELYEEGVEQGHLSALVQQYKDGLVNLNLGNLKPNETVIVHLEIVSGVTCSDSGFRFRFPFTLAPGYHPRAATGVTEEGEGEINLPESVFGDVLLPRWQESGKDLHRIGFNITVQLPDKEAELSSPSHAVSVRLKDTSAQVKLALEADLPDRDLVLEVKHPMSKPLVLCGTDAAGKGRFCSVVPSSFFGKSNTSPRELVFLVDRSGSMGGAAMEQAKRAVLACIAALRPEDRFGLIFFDNEPAAFAHALVQAGQEQRNKACAFVETMDARGGTELSAALKAAAALLPVGGDILLLTDGQVFETDTIIARAKADRVRVHCLGIGSAGQDRFITLLARATGGISRTVTPRERVDEAALRLFASLGNRIAGKVRYTVKGIKQAVLSPTPASTVFEGAATVLFGACGPKGAGEIECAWEGGAATIPLAIVKDGLGESLKLIQGSRLMTDLEVEGAHESESGPLAKRHKERLNRQWKKLAEEYGLANPAMSLVAVVKRKGDRPGQVPVTQIVPVGIPQDTGYDAYFAPSRVHGLRAGLMPAAPPFVCNEALPEKRGFSLDRMECRSLPKNLSMRAMRKSRHASSAREDSFEKIMTEMGDFDLLMELAASLQADGGLGGASFQERIVRTLVALLALLEYSEKDRAGGDGEVFRLETAIFAPHIQRMRHFLQANATAPLDGVCITTVHDVMAEIDRGRIPQGNWREQCKDGGLNLPVDQLWGIVQKAVPLSAPKKR